MSMNLATVEQAMLALDKRDLATVIRRGIQALDEIESRQVSLLTADDVDVRVDKLLAKFQGWSRCSTRSRYFPISCFVLKGRAFSFCSSYGKAQTRNAPLPKL